MRQSTHIPTQKGLLYRQIISSFLQYCGQLNGSEAITAQLKEIVFHAGFLPVQYRIDRLSKSTLFLRMGRHIGRSLRFVRNRELLHRFSICFSAGSQRQLLHKNKSMRDHIDGQTGQFCPERSGRAPAARIICAQKLTAILCRAHQHRGLRNALHRQKGILYLSQLHPLTPYLHLEVIAANKNNTSVLAAAGKVAGAVHFTIFKRIGNKLFGR